MQKAIRNYFVIINEELASLLNMNREEREQYVIQLWKAGRTVRDIA
jgi:hypothetical protein